MKKGALLNSELSYLISTLGHTDEVTICDAGLPIPESTTRIDLALTYGVPGFLDTITTYLHETQIEGVILAEELPKVSPELHEELLSLLKAEEERCGKTFAISYVSHEIFKQHTHSSRAIVRTGECTPYANVIFQSGVAF